MLDLSWSVIVSDVMFDLNPVYLEYWMSLPVLANTRDWAKGDPKSKLHPWYVTGITDGEGSFGVGVISGSRFGKDIKFQYKVTQKAYSAGILYDLQAFFGCGSVSIDNREDNTLKYQVQSHVDLLTKVFPYFDQYPLQTSKQLNYLDFRSIAMLLKELKDQVPIKSQQGQPSPGLYINSVLEKIMILKAGMNKGRSYESKWNYLSRIKFDLDPHWVLAFIDGEGTFYVDNGWMGANTRANPWYNVRAGLEIVQSHHDVKVLDAIRAFFGQGSIHPVFDINSMDAALSSPRSVARYKLRNSEPIVKLFSNHMLLTRKWLDYLDWKQIVDLKAKQVHLTEEGRKQIIAIKAGMNRGQKD